MPVVSIRARIECEECSIQFSVELDAARSCTTGWTMFDMAVDAVRGGLDYEQHSSIAIVPGHSPLVSSVQDGKMLCAACTAEYDARENAKEAS